MSHSPNRDKSQSNNFNVGENDCVHGDDDHRDYDHGDDRYMQAYVVNHKVFHMLFSLQPSCQS